MKKHKLIYKPIIILIACGCLNACWKPKEETEIKIDQESKDYCLFGQGSYWIYQDSATLKIDSIVIDNPIHYDFGKSRGNGCVIETYFTRITSYSQDSICDFSVDLTTRLANSEDLKPCLLMKGGWTLYHNGEIGETVYSMILFERKDTYSLNGITYYNIKIFKLNDTKMYYWAKHVGLIRVEIYENDSVISVSNLVKYSIKQHNN